MRASLSQQSNLDESAALARVATSPAPLASDVETDTEHWWRGNIGVASFAWGRADDEAFATRNVAAAHAALQYRMNAGLPTNFHNCSFDLHFWKNRGLKPNWKAVGDTLLQARLHSNLGDNRLDQLGATVLGIPPHKNAVKGWLQKNRKAFNVQYGRVPNYLDVPDEILLPYAAQDTRTTYGLASYYISNPNSLYSRELELRRLMFDAEEFGVQVDPVLIQQRLTQVQVEQVGIEQRLTQMRGSAINFDSDKQIGAWLYDELGLTPVSHTPGGQPQVNEFNLTSNPHPVTRLIIARNKRAKAAEFFESYLNLMDPDCRIHPTVNTMQARTHRFSCSDPNLQQIPVRNDRFHTRSVFHSGDGWFIGADFDKQEIFIAACEGNETQLIQDLLAGKDIYVDFARAMLEKQQIAGSERQAAKVAVLSMLYGAGAPKVAESFTVNTGRPYTVDQARVMRANFKAKYPGLAELMNRCQAQAREFGKVRNRWNRELYVEYDRAYVATDYLVQSSGRDVLGDALINVASILPKYGGRLLWPIHDEVLIWVPEQPSPALLDEVREAMVCRKFQLPLTATPKYGKTLADLK
jgi:DNA polymerase-1